MSGFIICSFRGHRVNRRRVWHDGVDFRTTCERCHQPLVRDDRAGWRVFDEVADNLPGRHAHHE